MEHLHENKIKFLEEKANAIRESIISMLVEAGSGHTAGPLGMADIFTALYFHILKHDPKNPAWEERDRLVLSNGHICPVLYATMAHAGYFPVEELGTLRKFGSRLQGHPHRDFLPALETSSGPLGSGLSQAVGMALAARMDRENSAKTAGPEKNQDENNRGKSQIVCLMSDGEHDSGQIWEAALLAGKNKLDNLTAVIDRNNIQIDGMTEDIMPLEPLRAKYEAFNWQVIDINAHDFHEIANAFDEAYGVYEKPVLIIAHTVPGKGIPEIEFDYRWHGIAPNKDQAAHFLDVLRTFGGKIAGEHK